MATCNNLNVFRKLNKIGQLKAASSFEETSATIRVINYNFKVARDQQQVHLLLSLSEISTTTTTATSEEFRLS